MNRRTFIRRANGALLAGIGLASKHTEAATPRKNEADAVRKEQIPYKVTPSRALNLTVYYPPDWKVGDHRSAIVFYFGGGWQKGNVEQFAVQSTHFARRGLVACCADYRVKSKDNVTPEVCVEDAKSAVRWLRMNCERFGVAPSRIAAGGGSAGGHLAACTALTPDIVGPGEDAAIPSTTCALVLFNPVLDFTGVPRLMERIANYEALARTISPTQHLNESSPPTVLFYGAEDPLLDQGKAFAAKAKELGLRADLHVTPDQNHGFFNRPPFQGSTLKMADEFLVSIGLVSPALKSGSSSR
ncbi:MAG: lipase [Candidatus Hydrogenedentota bacterium]